VYFSEWHVGRALSLARRLSRQRFKLLLCNGTMAGEGFDHLDHVQELTPGALEWVLERGADPRAHSVLPLGFFIDPQLDLPSELERAALRKGLDLPVDRRIVLSVAALNRYHKRLDYVIEELASLPDPRPFLLLAGQPEDETPGIISLARERLHQHDYSIRSVPVAEVPRLYRASDAFVLASLYEGLPRALIEAMAHGLPCLAHAYPITDFALGPHGFTADLSRKGALAELLSSLDDRDLQAARAAERHRFVYERFSWDRLRPRYVELLRRVAGC
jgi:1,2-diacylglycerol 3-alpha-glucosyltransferase